MTFTFFETQFYVKLQNMTETFMVTQFYNQSRIIAYQTIVIQKIFEHWYQLQVSKNTTRK